jgi:hypothetical protein
MYEFLKFFAPKPAFIGWMKQFADKPVYDVGARLGHVSKALSEAGLQVIALDLEILPQREFDVIKADSTKHPFKRGSVVMLCRPCHDGFVFRTITRAIEQRVDDVVYVGLLQNAELDLREYKPLFVRKRLRGIGHFNEYIWHMDLKKLRG